MLVLEVLGILLLVMAVASPMAGQHLSDRGSAEIAAQRILPAVIVQRAYRAVETHQATLAPALNTREKLLRLEEVDQAGRQVLGDLRINEMPETERAKAWASVWAVINQHDLECQHRLAVLTPTGDWFRSSIVGRDGANAALLIVQHAVNNPMLMRFVAHKLALYAPLGEASGSNLALITDRIALEFDHKPQTYGTQVSCLRGKWSPTDLADATHLDERRNLVGLEPEAAYLKRFDHKECPTS